MQKVRQMYLGDCRYLLFRSIITECENSINPLIRVLEKNIYTRCWEPFRFCIKLNTQAKTITIIIIKLAFLHL